MSQAPLSGDVQASFCSAVVDEWARGGLTEAVIAPGSRSTPFLLALEADPRIRVHVALDERSAGFMALGIGLACKRPATVVTTSGTAAVELHPAIVEASHAGVPLVAVTADRPPELHGVGAPQTVDQDGLYGSSPRWATSPGVAEAAASHTWRSLAARALIAATSAPGGAGPVHLNLAFREPLIGSPRCVPPGRPNGEPWHRVVPAAGAAVGRDLVELLVARAGTRGLIVAGGGTARSQADAEVVIAAARRLGWPIFADSRSGVRIPAEPVVAAADALLRGAPASWRPETVLRIGDPWASKVVSQWLGQLGTDVLQVLADPWARWADPDRQVAVVTPASGPDIAAAVIDRLENPAAPSEWAQSEWAQSWSTAERAAQDAFARELGPSGPLAMSEPGVARAVVAGVPDGGVLVVSSSMPIRDVEWYGAPRSGLEVVANRGANGIDGVVSTAIGAALATSRPVVALLGDLAFLHDAGALLGCRDRPVKLTLVVVDNDGGGIFSFLPQATELPVDQFERYWGTPPGVDVSGLAAVYGAHVVEAADPASLTACLASSSEPGVRVVRVRSDRAANVKAHDRVHEVVRAALPAQPAVRVERGRPVRPEA